MLKDAQIWLLPSGTRVGRMVQHLQGLGSEVSSSLHDYYKPTALLYQSLWKSSSMQTKCA